jgi:hypothetical protein
MKRGPAVPGGLLMSKPTWSISQWAIDDVGFLLSSCKLSDGSGMAHFGRFH